MRHKRGISLVALVITVIIMIILAGISFTAIFGDNGIIRQAMLSKEKTENAATKEIIELAWSARLSKYYEDLALGNASSFASYMLDTAYWSEELESFGDFIGIEKVGDGSTYNFLLKDKNGNNYQVAVSSSGKAEIKEDHIDNDRVLAILTTGNYELAEGVQVEDFVTPREEKEKVSLYGTKVTTGVTQINGVAVDDNWKIFYIDDDDNNGETTEYVYLIYGYYYPNKALQSMSSITTSSTIKYNISGVLNGTREDLVDDLTNTDNWNLIVNAFHGTSKFATANISAFGSPTIDMWIASANEKYGTNYGILSVNNGTEEVGYLFKVDGSSETEEWKSNLSEDTMPYQEMYDDELFYPTHDVLRGEEGGAAGLYGYWTTSLSAKSIESPLTGEVSYVSVVCINSYNGAVFGNAYGSGNYAIRPVIQIPKSEFEDIENIAIK